MGIRRVGADHEDDVGLLDAPEVLGAGGFAERRLEAVAGRRVAHARAGVDVVVAEGRAHHALHDVDLLVRRARGGDAADRAAPVLLLRGHEAVGGELDRLVPGDDLPGIGDLLADHRVQHAVLVRRVAEREAALDAGVALVGAAVLVRHHAHDLLALHLGLERAADAAVGAGRHHRVLGLAVIDDRFLDQRRRRAGLHAGAAGDALGLRGSPRPCWPRRARQSRARRSSARRCPAPPRRRARSASRRCTWRARTGSRDWTCPCPATAGSPRRWSARTRGSRRRSRSARRAGRPRPPCPAARSRRWPRRSGSRADGRRCRAPSRPCGCGRGARSGS